MSKVGICRECEQEIEVDGSEFIVLHGHREGGRFIPCDGSGTIPVGNNIRNTESPEYRVDALSDDNIRATLIRVVQAVDAGESIATVWSILNQWSLVNPRKDADS